MPFAALNNIELILENESIRNVVMDKLENNGFKSLLREVKEGSDTSTDVIEINNQYFDTEQLNTFLTDDRSNTSVIHINIRRIAKNKGKLLGLLSTLNREFDIIILTEIGHDAEHYINNNFLPNYDAFMDTPKCNKYGGTAILVKEGYGNVTIRDDLAMTRICNCSKCHLENTWVEIKTTNEVILIGALYRHPNVSLCDRTGQYVVSYSKKY